MSKRTQLKICAISYSIVVLAMFVMVVALS